MYSKNDKTMDSVVGRPPTFVHIGGQRCGTSWMHKCLSEHPNVLTSDPKEIHFFDKNYNKGEEWYINHFIPTEKNIAWGEFTPEYLTWQNSPFSVPRQLHNMSPNCKIICCLRNPVDRAYSQWNYWAGNKDSFEKSIKHNYNNILGRGLYAKHIERWLCYFDRDQILIQIHDDVLEDNKTAVREVFKHIGVNSSFVPHWVDKAYNSVVFPGLKKAIREMGMTVLIDLFKKTRVGKMFRRIAHSKKKKKSGYDNMDRDLRGRLISYYKEPNKRLSRLLGRDMSAWNK
jgi:hypothetical protein